MPFPAADAAAWLVGVAGALVLFRVGLQFPLPLRLRGDAGQYVLIAASFDGVASALSYIGERTPGMPLFLWLFRPRQFDWALLQGWMAIICGALLLTHLVASVGAVRLANRHGLVRTPGGRRAFFILLAAFPALIGHTTVPLTDTLAVDLSIAVFLGWSYAERSCGWRSIVWAAGAGAVAAYVCLVRPAYLIPMAAATAIWCALGWWRERRGLMALAAVAALCLPLGSVALRCEARYGTACLQDPGVFPAARHAQMGLRGGRLLWSGPQPANGEFPVLPDPILVEAYYRRCTLTHIVGVDASSLTGCLLGRPHVIPIYLFKKWVALFDHFRFQPYTEFVTPPWLRRLSRTFDAVAWTGFVAILGVAATRARRWRDLAAQPVLAACLGFLALMLAQHTILHPEDRFGLVFVPATLGAVVAVVEALPAMSRSHRWRVVYAAVVCVSVFAWQIAAWDSTSF